MSASLTRTGCLDYAYDWRREAANLRERTEAHHLTDDQRTVLHSEANAADRQADGWLEAAIIH